MVTTLDYDSRGRLLSRTVAGETTRYAYDAVGQLALVTLPDGSTLRYIYDGAHRLTELQDGLGNRIVYTLDGLGNRTSEKVYDHAGALTRTRARVYNALNWLDREVGAAGQTTRYGYDRNGNVTSVVDPLDHETANAYDALNRLVKVTDPAGGQTRYTYEPSGALLQVNDPRDVATGYGYDGLRNQTQLRSPDAGASALTFDANGNLVSRVDARGVTASYSFDALNRMTGLAFARAGVPGEIHRFEYDGVTTSPTHAKGRLTRVVDPAGEIRLTYTAAGRVASKTQLAGGTTLSVGYAYNAAGQLERMTTPSGQQIGYGYLNNRIVAITVNGQRLLSGVVALPFGAMGGWQWSNSFFTLRRFDQDGRLSSWEYSGGSTALRRNLGLDPASRIIAITDPSSPASNLGYGYDTLDRLTTAQLGNPRFRTVRISTSSNSPIRMWCLKEQ